MKIPGLPQRRPSLPAALSERLGLTAADRVLAWSALPEDGVAVATIGGLRILTPFGKRIDRPWVAVDHAAWDEDSHTLAVWWVGSRQATGLEVGAGSFLPEVVHERVRASVVLTRDVPVSGRKPVWVALRKDVDGSLITQAVPPPGVRLDDPDVAAAVARATASLRDEAGLPPYEQPGPADARAGRP